MAKKKESKKKKKEDNLKIDGDFIDVLKKSVEGNPKGKAKPKK